MRCAEIEDMISAHANGELSPEERELVAKHLSGCADCREKLAEYGHIRQQLETLRVTPVEPDIKVSVMSRIKSAGLAEKPFRVRRNRILIMVPVAVVLVALLIIQPWGFPVAPESIIARAYSAIEGLTSYRLSVMRSDDSEGTNSVFEAEFSAPDRYHIKQTFNGEDKEIILIGDEQYYKGNLDSFLYMKPQANAYSTMLTRETTLEWLDMLTDIRELPMETLEGVRCLHFLGVYDYEKALRSQHDAVGMKGLPPLSEQELEQRLEEYRSTAGARSFELWIGKDDYLLRRIKVETQRPAENGKVISSSTTYKFFDFNQPIIIEAPLDSSGKLLPNWASSIPEQPAFKKEVQVEIENYDPENRNIIYTVNLTNISGEALTGLEVRVMPTFSVKDSSVGFRTTGGPTGPGLYIVQPDESLNYEITFIYNAAVADPQKIVDFINESPLYIGYLKPDGRQKVELVRFKAPDSIYTLPIELPSVRNLAPVGEYKIEEPGASSARYSVSGEIGGKKYLFVLVDSQSSETQVERGILVLDIQDPAQPVKTAFLKSPQNTGYMLQSVLSDTVLYVPADNYLWIIDVSNPAVPRELSSFSEIKPINIAISGKYAYINDRNQKISTVDISDPSHPQVIGSLELTSRSSLGLDILGDYLLAWAGDTLHTIDISSPAALRIVNSHAFSLPADPTDASLRISPAHVGGKSIVGNYAFIALGGEGADGISVMDISAPAGPFEIAFLELKDRQIGGDLFASGNRAYVITRSDMDLRIKVEFIDISNPAKPAKSGFGRLPDWWSFFNKTSSGFSYSYNLIDNYLYWFIGTAPNQPVIKIFDLSGP